MRYLQGREYFPTGGKVREPNGMNRCDSGTDSTVWMEEDRTASVFSEDTERLRVSSHGGARGSRAPLFTSAREEAICVNCFPK